MIAADSAVHGGDIASVMVNATNKLLLIVASRSIIILANIFQ
jgi:hypothetical protein